MVRRKSVARRSSGSEMSSQMRNKLGREISHGRIPFSRRPKSRVLHEIKHLRNTTNLIIPKAAFTRLVKEIVLDLFPRLGIHRMQGSALEALQEAAEMYIVQFFEDTVLLTIHAKRITLMRQDMMLMRRLRGRHDVINR